MNFFPNNSSELIDGNWWIGLVAIFYMNLLKVFRFSFLI